MPHQINSIQYLRGIAAIIIVFRHLSDRTDKYHIVAPGLNGFDIGIWGVDLFFVISGFVMVYITKSDQLNFRQVLNFWQRRYLRISPMYYLMTGLMLIVAIFAPNTTELKPSFEHTIKSLLYIPSHKKSPVLGVGWTLNYEMYFYFIFGLTLLLPKKYQTSTMVIGLFGSFLFGLIYPGENAFILQITNPLLIEFLFGYLIGKCFCAEKEWPPFLAVILLVISCISIIYADFKNIDRELRLLIYGIPSAGLVSSLIALEAQNILKFKNKLFLLAGEVSYSLYLVHILVIAAYGKLVMKFSLYENVNGYVLFFFDFVVCFLTATLISKAIEQPLHEY
jgi:exopolysaccharide production protein ExoZ